MVRYTTRDGITLEVGRVERRLLDAVALPPPTPPTRAVEAWGGIVEHVRNYDDPGYRRTLHRWRVTIWRAQLHILAAALTFTLPESSRVALDALRAIGMGDGTDADYLRFCVCEADQDALVELVLYHSTVTTRGVDEAAQRLGYTWRDKPVLTWAVGYTHGQRGQLGVDMRAAVRSHLSWLEFCDLPGPEQSALVAFWMLEERLNWLAEHNAN